MYLVHHFCRQVSDVLRGHLHRLRQYGNYGAHFSAEEYPLSLEHWGEWMESLLYASRVLLGRESARL